MACLMVGDIEAAQADIQNVMESLGLAEGLTIKDDPKNPGSSRLSASQSPNRGHVYSEQGIMQGKPTAMHKRNRVEKRWELLLN